MMMLLIVMIILSIKNTVCVTGYNSFNKNIYVRNWILLFLCSEVNFAATASSSAKLTEDMQYYLCIYENNNIQHFSTISLSNVMQAFVAFLLTFQFMLFFILLLQKQNVRKLT